MSDFAGLRVLALESRRGAELAKLISNYGGEPVVAPAMREVPLESNTEALSFAEALRAGKFDIVIFLTGVGTRAVLNVAETKYSRDDFIAALKRVKVVPRGPKPIAVLRELGVTPALTVPEPNTWRELLQSLDEAEKSSPEFRLRGARTALQEYGVSNPELISGLTERGAVVTRVPVYQWALPEDLAPLQAAIKELAAGKFDAVFFTTGIQAAHLFQVAAEMKLEDAMRQGLRRAIVASIGPTTSEELQRHGIRPDLEPSHPKMGFLVKEAAEQAAALLTKKRQGTASV
ncbi:MAG TPA: uroporphyrinogen-III synthase [Candidatus Bathyarchaeia archaeon]|jgi:uroporphyrinogen-III synthase|nr:uroporphyrinogen-III synthase [Candidatus Bathyarchaeia archaeon]